MRSYYWNQSYSANLTIKSLRPAVELKEEYIKTDIKKTLDLLDEELVGLVPVKTRIREIAALLLVDQIRKQTGLSAGNPGLHMYLQEVWYRKDYCWSKNGGYSISVKLC